MELLLSGIMTLVFFGGFILYVYSFILLWADKELENWMKLIGTLLFFTVFPASWIYLIYRFFRS